MTWTIDLDRIVCCDGRHVAIAENYQVARAIVDGLNLLEARLDITQDDEVGRIAWTVKLNQWARSTNAHNPPDDPGERKA